MNVDGSNPRPDHARAWSTTTILSGHLMEKKIIATAVTKDQERICIMNPDGSGMQTLTPPNIRAIHGSWSLRLVNRGDFSAPMTRRAAEEERHRNIYHRCGD